MAEVLLAEARGGPVAPERSVAEAVCAGQAGIGTERIEPLGAREGDERIGIGDDDHELKRSSVRRSSSRSETL